MVVAISKSGFMSYFKIFIVLQLSGYMCQSESDALFYFHSFIYMCYFLFYVLTIAKSRANVRPVKFVISAGIRYVVDSLFVVTPIVYQRLCFFNSFRSKGNV